MIKLSDKSKTILKHCVGILIFLSLPIFFSPDFLKGSDLFNVAPFRMFMLFQIFLLLIFYVNYYWLTERFLMKGKYLWYFSMVLILFILTELVFNFLSQSVVIHLPDNPDFRPGPPFRKFGRMIRPMQVEVFKHVFQFTVMIVLGNLIRIDARRRKIESEKKTLELSFLKSQIQPHFLFNTLNSIYALALEKSEYTAKAVVKLSDMMRYVMYDAPQDWVSLEKEINYLRNYIDLQALRLSDRIKLEVSMVGDFTNAEIAPMILVTFIENAFKHGANPDQGNRIRISLNYEAGILDLNVFNDKSATETVDEVLQIGVKNTMQRLNHSYHARYELRIAENAKDYTLHLKLNLK